jgi:RimJ/RimL family protein N-acetyltransferase
MNETILSVRDLQENDVDLITHYWLGADPLFLKGMGVDLAKLPAPEELRRMLLEQIGQPMEEKGSYCVIWLVNDNPVGHSNVNKIIYGEEAYMHLHLWKTDIRKKGLGTALIKLTLPCFFENLKLKNLYCEPYALNPAPNKTLEKAGFQFVKKHITVPGWLNFEQPVLLWQLSYDSYKRLK